MKRRDGPASGCAITIRSGVTSRTNAIQRLAPALGSKHSTFSSPVHHAVARAEDPAFAARPPGLPRVEPQNVFEDLTRDAIEIATDGGRLLVLERVRRGEILNGALRASQDFNVMTNRFGHFEIVKLYINA